MIDNLEEFYNLLDEENKRYFSKIADFAFSLGYKVKRAKTKDINFVFTNSKTKKHILKFAYEKNKAVVKLKYYASRDYSHFFQECIRETIEEYDFKYTGCYKCGKCKDGLKGYYYLYPNGRQYFRCGGELISLPHITENILPELLDLLKKQHEFYLEQN